MFYLLHENIRANVRENCPPTKSMVMSKDNYFSSNIYDLFYSREKIKDKILGSVVHLQNIVISKGLCFFSRRKVKIAKLGKDMMYLRVRQGENSENSLIWFLATKHVPTGSLRVMCMVNHT